MRHNRGGKHLLNLTDNKTRQKQQQPAVLFGVKEKNPKQRKIGEMTMDQRAKQREKTGKIKEDLSNNNNN